VTLVPQVAIDVEVRNERVKFLRFTPPQPGRTIGLAGRRTSPRKVDFIALGQLVTEAPGSSAEASSRVRRAGKQVHRA
jgi:LysR family hydrogen peroxide-inducible transcriptional activator